MADVKLRLQLVDVYEKPLGEKVDIILRHQVFQVVRNKLSGGPPHPATETLQLALIAKNLFHG